MLVCHCYGVTDHDIRDAVRRGDEVVVAGTDCGGCLPVVESLVAAEKHALNAAAPRSLPVITGTHAPVFIPVGAAAGPE